MGHLNFLGKSHFARAIFSFFVFFFQNLYVSEVCVSTDTKHTQTHGQTQYNLTWGDTFEYVRYRVVLLEIKQLGFFCFFLFFLYLNSIYATIHSFHLQMLCFFCDCNTLHS